MTLHDLFGSLKHARRLVDGSLEALNLYPELRGGLKEILSRETFNWDSVRVILTCDSVEVELPPVDSKPFKPLSVAVDDLATLYLSLRRPVTYDDVAGLVGSRSGPPAAR